jgi:hypothetical protein
MSWCNHHQRWCWLLATRGDLLPRAREEGQTCAGLNIHFYIDIKSFVTEDGLRVYNIQLCIFLFVTSKSKETLWLCVLDSAVLLQFWANIEFIWIFRTTNQIARNQIFRTPSSAGAARFARRCRDVKRQNPRQRRPLWMWYVFAL